jgi:DNA mismatch endonuclease, patch repair protein
MSQPVPTIATSAVPSSERIVPSVPAAPPASSSRARNVMLGNRSESAIERALRSTLHRRGLRFRKHAAPVPGLRCRPDVVFTRQRVVVFVDGCFWHRCPIHGTDSKANDSYWRPKLDANVARDRRNDRALAAAGWTVLRFWAHEPVDDMAHEVVFALRRSTRRPHQRSRSDSTAGDRLARR